MGATLKTDCPNKTTGYIVDFSFAKSDYEGVARAMPEDCLDIMLVEVDERDDCF